MISIVPGSSLRATTGRPRFGVLAIVLTVGVLAAACSGSSDGTAASTSVPTHQSTTSTPAAGSAAEVIAAYKAAELAGIQAGVIPDPNYPALEQTATGPMLQQTKDVLRGYELRKIALKYPEPLESGFEVTVDPAEVELTDDTAVFDACAVDRGERISTENGAYVSPNDGPDTFLLRVGMRRVDGIWKLAERRELDSWKGIAGCAA
jgi:hypothetical protein